jgi:hypothetical protein
MPAEESTAECGDEEQDVEFLSIPATSMDTPDGDIWR